MRRVERFGVFVTLAGSDGKLTGLAHISECADGRVDDLGKLFAAGQGGSPGCIACEQPSATPYLGCIRRPELRSWPAECTCISCRLALRHQTA